MHVILCMASLPVLDDKLEVYPAAHAAAPTRVLCSSCALQRCAHADANNPLCKQHLLRMAQLHKNILQLHPALYEKASQAFCGLQLLWTAESGSMMA